MSANTAKALAIRHSAAAVWRIEIAPRYCQTGKVAVEAPTNRMAIDDAARSAAPRQIQKSGAGLDWSRGWVVYRIFEPCCHYIFNSECITDNF
jgi:hypothetical protein